MDTDASFDINRYYDMSCHTCRRFITPLPLLRYSLMPLRERQTLLRGYAVTMPFSYATEPFTWIELWALGDATLRNEFSSLLTYSRAHHASPSLRIRADVVFTLFYWDDGLYIIAFSSLVTTLRYYRCRFTEYICRHCQMLFLLFTHWYFRHASRLR